MDEMKKLAELKKREKMEDKLARYIVGNLDVVIQMNVHTCWQKNILAR